MKLKNYTKEGQKLPLFGIGPYLIYPVEKAVKINENPTAIFRN